MRKFHYLLCLLLLPILGNAQITVTSTADSGPGTLRQAIIDANTDAGLDNIFFNINGGGAQTISIISDLPSITDDGVSIDGTTQPGYVDSPLISMNGNGGIYYGLGFFSSNNCSLIGLRIVNFGSYGVTVSGCDNLSIYDNIITENIANQILLSTSSNCSIVNNIIGIDSNGAAASTEATGIRLQVGSINNYIGGNTIGGLNNIDQPIVAIMQAESSFNTIDIFTI